jgi:hypothetical protein
LPRTEPPYVGRRLQGTGRRVRAQARARGFGHGSVSHHCVGLSPWSHAGDARARRRGGRREGAAHSATSGAYPLLPADRCYPFPLYPYLNRLCTSSVQGCYRVMTRLNGSTEELLCQVFRQREQLGRAAASLFAAADTLHKSLRGRHDTTVPLLDTVPGSALVTTINETGRQC